MSSSIACIYYKNKKIFIAKRQNVGQMGGKWEFPGGKIEAGESFEQAIKREMQEEFNVQVKVLQKITSSTFIHNEKECTLDAFAVEFEHDGIEKPFDLTEHSEYKWVKPEIIKQLDFVDSDMKLYPEILKYIKSLKKEK